jgi:hypothetical protein
MYCLRPATLAQRSWLQFRSEDPSKGVHVASREPCLHCANEVSSCAILWLWACYTAIPFIGCLKLTMKSWTGEAVIDVNVFFCRTGIEMYLKIVQPVY